MKLIIDRHLLPLNRFKLSQAIALTVCLVLIPLTIGGCSKSSEQELNDFQNRILNLLGDDNSVKFVASELTNFPWDNLCFERKKTLELTFISTNSDVVFNLDYQDYFVDEAYVADSLDGRCISSHDQLLIKRKYPGYSKTIQFFNVNK